MRLNSIELLLSHCKQHFLFTYSSIMISFRYTCIICVILFFCSCNQESIQKEEGRKQALDSLQKICQSTLFTHKGFESARLLKDEADKQDNDLYIGHAYKYMLLTAFNTHQEDSISFFADKAKYYFEAAKDQDELFNIDMSLIEWEMQFGNAYIALDKATRLLEDVKGDSYIEFHAYELISNVYNILGRLNQSETAFLKMLEIRDKKKLSVNHQMPYIYLRGAQIQSDLKKYEQALVYCDSSQVYIDKYYDDSSNGTLLVLLNLNKANSFVGSNRLNEAKASLDVLDGIIQNDEAHPFYFYAQAAWANYYKVKGDYGNALARIQPAIDRFKKNEDTPNYLKAAYLQAEVLALMNNYKNAYELNVKNNAYSDSIALENTDKHLNELQTVYQVDRLNNELEQGALKIKNRQIIIISLILISLVLLITTIIVVRNSIILRRKNEKLFSQYKEKNKQDAIRNVALSQKRDKSELTLFERIELYLNESEYYLNPTISRESLALELATNREYLTKAIQEAVDMTFTEYIYDFRLNYSCRLLGEETNLSIDEIYLKAGFNNKSTFYRLFKQKYDLTPKEFQKIARKS